LGFAQSSVAEIFCRKKILKRIVENGPADFAGCAPALARASARFYAFRQNLTGIISRRMSA
jgi:hypothetical protein